MLFPLHRWIHLTSIAQSPNFFFPSSDSRPFHTIAPLSSLSLCALGKMFKSLDLSLIVEFILMFYKDKPIDWLLDHILWVKVCNPEKDAVRKQPPLKGNVLLCVGKFTLG